MRNKKFELINFQLEFFLEKNSCCLNSILKLSPCSHINQLRRIFFVHIQKNFTTTSTRKTNISAILVHISIVWHDSKIWNLVATIFAHHETPSQMLESSRPDVRHLSPPFNACDWPSNDDRTGLFDSFFSPDSTGRVTLTLSLTQNYQQFRSFALTRHSKKFPRRHI